MARCVLLVWCLEAIRAIHSRSAQVAQLHRLRIETGMQCGGPDPQATVIFWACLGCAGHEISQRGAAHLERLATGRTSRSGCSACQDAAASAERKK